MQYFYVSLQIKLEKLPGNGAMSDDCTSGVNEDFLLNKKNNIKILNIL